MDEHPAVHLNRMAFAAAPRTAGFAPDLQLIYIHGLGGSCGNWYFNYMLPWRGRFHQLAYDLRGHGDSDYPPRGYATRHHADDLRSLVAGEAGVAARRCFVAYSYGGCVALEYAMRHAAPGDSVVLLDSPPVTRIDASLVEELVGLKAAMRGEADGAQGRLAVEFTATMGPGGRSKRTIGRYARRLERLLETGFPVEVVKETAPAAADLAAIRCRLLLVYASRGDGLEHAERLRTLVPQARLATLDAGHDLIATHAGEIRSLILEFLQV